MKYSVAAISAVAGLALASAGWVATSSAEDQPENPLGELYSGYTLLTPETKEMQDDDFVNPGFLWVEQGQEEWGKVEGEAGKSCASCHGDAEESMKGVATHYPKYDKDLGKVVTLEQRINMCRENQMKAKPYKWESDQLLGMTAFVKYQSRGMPMDVDISGPAKEFWEKGKEYYYERHGQLDLACSHCHEQNNGNWIRADHLSQGQSNGFPTYRLKWQKMGSLHRRFRGCNDQIRAAKLPNGSDEYTNLEFYLAWRGNGLPIETPAVRR